ncbi:MAG: cytochrome c [Gemmatimonadota bacterium]|nr:cytochrome c [Gemmatimonadota bacterium]
MCRLRFVLKLDRRVLPFLIGVTALVAGCAADTPAVPIGPDGEPDPVLAVGRDVWSQHCASCHGASGGGGSGPKLNDGKVVEAFPDAADESQLILDGIGEMPGFAGKLSDSELEAVVRYTREVLG